MRRSIVLQDMKDVLRNNTPGSRRTSIQYRNALVIIINYVSYACKYVSLRRESRVLARDVIYACYIIQFFCKLDAIYLFIYLFFLFNLRRDLAYKNNDKISPRRLRETRWIY